MENRTYYTIGQAAEATGKAKSTIKKAIDNGELSVAEKTSRGFKIDAAALHSVFPIKTVERSKMNDNEQTETPQKTIENSILQVKLDAAHQRWEDAQAQIEDLQKRLDNSEAARERQDARLEDQRDKTERLLADQLEKVPEPPRKGLFARLRG